MNNNIEKKRPEDCKLYSGCSSALCPLDPGLKEMIWCPEENGPGDICRNPEFRDMQFVKTQRKIAKAVKKRNEERDDYFTYDMLNRDIVIKSGIRGISEPSNTKDPMKWYLDKERKWLLEHPVKKQLSLEEIERRRQRMKTLKEEVEI
ncbi:MAG: hypothetical protein QXQ46_10115 [Thermoplasmatales archaeon]